MSQKREKEETELKVTEKLSMCAPMPTIPASPAAPHLPPARFTDAPDPDLYGAGDGRTSSGSSPAKPDTADAEEKRGGSVKRPREVNRCSGSGCRKRIGLMGFRCRCGDVFCSEHRYTDRHDCSYDYKAAGRDAIARENPVVRAAKLLKV